LEHQTLDKSPATK